MKIVEFILKDFFRNCDSFDQNRLQYTVGILKIKHHMLRKIRVFIVITLFSVLLNQKFLRSRCHFNDYNLVDLVK